MRKIPLYLLAAIILNGCNPKSDQFCGTYNGTLPAASNPGIETTINFEKDHTFQAKLVYVDEKDGVFYERGTYQIKNKLLTALPVDNDPQYYQIEEGQIRRLNSDKKPITSDLADYYVLKQTRNCN